MKKIQVVRTGKAVWLNILVFAGAVSLLSYCYSARADFIGTYSKWSNLDESAKVGLVMGIFDVRTIAIKDTPWSEALSDGLHDCARSTELDAGLLVQAIDDWYRANPIHWDKGAFYAFLEAIEKGICKNYVNAARISRGLPPW